LLDSLGTDRALELVGPMLQPYPVGLFVDDLGPVVANDAYAGRDVWEAFRRDAYHSPTVVWGRDVNALLAGLARAMRNAKFGMPHSAFRTVRCTRPHPDRGGPLRPAARGAVELHHRERTPGPLALRLQLGRAAVEPHRPRRPIPPQPPLTSTTSTNLHEPLM